MSKTDTLSIRIEPTLKKEVEETLNYLGMNIADAVTIFLNIPLKKLVYHHLELYLHLMFHSLF